MPKRRPDVRVCKKRFLGRCVLCGETAYEALDADRAFDPGGKYCWGGIVVACSSCHRKRHAGLIVIHGRYLTAKGHHVIHASVDGEERWIPEVSAT